MSEHLGPRIGKKRPFKSLAQEAFLNLWRANDLLGTIHDALFGEHQLTPYQYNVLRILRGQRPRALSMSDVRDCLITRAHAPDTTRLVDRLIERGFAERHVPEEDRRAVHITITKAGLEFLKVMDRPLLECHQRQLGHMSDEDLRKLIRLLEKARSPHERPPPTRDNL